MATTYDPATPYRGAKSLVRDLGNARLLTMRGDGHTAYPGNSPTCIDPAVEAYVNDGTLPAPGTSCKQDVAIRTATGGRAGAQGAGARQPAAAAAHEAAAGDRLIAPAGPPRRLGAAAGRVDLVRSAV